MGAHAEFRDAARQATPEAAGRSKTTKTVKQLPKMRENSRTTSENAGKQPKMPEKARATPENVRKRRKHIEKRHETGEIIFIGDRIEGGGNDYPLAQLMDKITDCSWFQTDGWEHTMQILENLSD